MRKRFGLVGVPTAVIMIVVMLIVPMPTILLDLLISANITGAIVILLMTMHVKRPLDFSVFPSVLLVATLFRLALDVSITRLILLNANAGSVVASFGHFVVGGQLVVGLVVFLIIIVIQFVVVTSGAGRVAEVAARFTLDAMPGKQMAIDADLNAGLIDQNEARRRRQDIANEADFYGAMDGASKFVRGDAIAAVVLVAISLLGGLAVGILEKHDSISVAVHTYSLLSVGDGLVSQIPALLMSISTGMIVTRAATDEDDFGADLLSQIRRQYRAVQIAGVILVVLGIVPGLPKLPFLVIGGFVWFLGYRLGSSVTAETEAAEAQVIEDAAPTLDTPQALAAEMRVEPLELELAPSIIDLVDSNRGGDLLDRVKALRRKLAMDKGLIIPTVRTRDNIALDADAYAIRLHGVQVAQGTAPPGRMLAIGAGIDALPGGTTTEPVFGLPAKWIPAELRQQALVGGATVIDRSSVITTHLGEVAAANAGRLLSAQQVRILLDSLKATNPALVEEMGAAQVTLTDLHRVLCGLLDEGVPVRDLVRIVEAVTERARQSKDAEGLLEAARSALGPAISASYARDGVLAVITLDAAFERSLAEAVRPGDDGSVLAVAAPVVEGLVREVHDLAQQIEQQGKEAVLLCASRLRPALRRLLGTAVPRLGVLSVNELGPQVKIDRIGVVNIVNPVEAV